MGLMHRFASLCLAAAVAVSASAAERKTTPITQFEKRGSGPVHLVLVPAFLCDWTAWEPFMERNKDAYTMWAVSLPGFGGTEPAPIKANEPLVPWMDNATDAIAEFIDAHGIKEPVVVGHSLGGVIALQMGFMYPDKVSRVVTVDGLPAYQLGAPMSPIERVGFVNQKVAPGMRAMTDEQWTRQLEMMSKAMTRTDEQAARFLTAASKTTRDAGVEWYIQLVKSDLTPWMFKLRAPTLAIAAIPAPGQQSTVTPAKVRETWREQLSAAEDAHIVFFEGASHFIMDDMPEAFDGAIADFIAGREPKNASRGGSGGGN